jgi:hypothetical protein
MGSLHSPGDFAPSRVTSPLENDHLLGYLYTYLYTPEMHFFLFARRGTFLDATGREGKKKNSKEREH